jgi:aminopeptidase
MDYAARYAERAVRVGVNLQPGQRLGLVGEPEHAPLVRTGRSRLARAGAGDVECVYLDEHVRRLHAIHAPEELLDRTPAWLETGPATSRAPPRS